MVRKTALIAALVWTQPASAQEPDSIMMETAGDVLRLCERQDRLSVGVCYGYIQGAILRDELATNDAERYLCAIPSGVTFEQLRQIVVSHIKARPAEWHFASVGTVLFGIREALCK